MPIRPKLTFFYDVVSPYSWLGFEVALRYQPIWDVELDFVPFFLGAVMKAASNVPPATVPLKAKYMTKEIGRTAKLLRVPFRKGFPSEFPSMSLKAMRVLTIVKAKTPDKLVPASRALWNMYWGEPNMPLSSEDNLVKFLAPILGHETILSYLKQSNEDSTVKQALVDNTNRAVEMYGCFGAPWLVLEHSVNGKPERELFFGSDRMEQISLLLNKPWYGPCPPDDKRASKL
eukprot:jgi/Hompol1/1718/HPOL_000257-RA